MFKEIAWPKLGLSVRKVARANLSEMQTALANDTGESGDAYDAEMSSVVKT